MNLSLPSYYVSMITGPKGRQTGYAVKQPGSGDVVAKFMNKDWNGYLFAQRHAYRLVELLNGAR